MVSGDRFLLGQAMQNLLDNAMDFSPEHGELWVQLEQDEHTVTWVVRDQGAGIPAYAQDRIFERFYSLPRGESDERSSGLGLCLVREVSELHGADIRIENAADGVGCVARWRLPIA